jgi:hypothetical protein
MDPEVIHQQSFASECEVSAQFFHKSLGLTLVLATDNLIITMTQNDHVSFEEQTGVEELALGESTLETQESSSTAKCDNSAFGNFRKERV